MTEFVLNAPIHFLAVDGDFRWGNKSQSHPVTLDSHYRQFDVRTNYNPFTTFSAQDQHERILSGVWHDIHFI